jgi:hypothetical protein
MHAWRGARGNLRAQAGEGGARLLYRSPCYCRFHGVAFGVPDEGSPRTGPTLDESSSNPRRGDPSRGAGAEYGRVLGRDGARAHAAAQRAPSDARDHVAARSIWSAARDALDRTAAATAASSTTAPCPNLSTPCVTMVVSTPANHNYPADRLPGARVAASCTLSLNLVKNQGVRVFAHYAPQSRVDTSPTPPSNGPR